MKGETLEAPWDDFQVEYREKHFALVGGRDLPTPVRDYLEAYLRKVSRYRPIGFYRGAPVLSLYQTPLSTPAGVRALKARLQRRLTGKRFPAAATLAVNKACQCRCEHCSAYHYNRSRKPELSAALWREAISQSVRLGVTQLIFVGGEPLLRRDLGELLAAVPQDEANAILFTNGEWLSAPWAEDLPERGLLGAFVSLDAANAAEHDRLRGRPGLFAKAMDGLRLWRRRGVLVGISSYLSPRRLEEGVFQAMMELGREAGASEVTFFDAIPSGSWLNSETCLLRPSDRKKIRALVELYRAKKGYPGISAQSLLTSGEGASFCFAANTQFYLSASGEMCPCDFTPLSVGSFPKENLETLWLRMVRSPPYLCRAKSCRMQDPGFRRAWIDSIPAGASLPWRIPQPHEFREPDQH